MNLKFLMIQKNQRSQMSRMNQMSQRFLTIQKNQRSQMNRMNQRFLKNLKNQKFQSYLRLHQAQKAQQDLEAQ
jgi:hypothetical protein